jgi:hypothetical protein
MVSPQANERVPKVMETCVVVILVDQSRGNGDRAKTTRGAIAAVIRALQDKRA